MLFESLYLLFSLGSEKAQQNAVARQVEQWDRELRQMDVWDSAERQIKEHCNFYNKTVLPKRKEFIYFAGNKDKSRNISMVDIQANREYWSSGLSPQDFAVKYFRKKFLDNPLWESEYESYWPGFTENKDLYLFDREGTETHFTLYAYYGDLHKQDHAKYRVIRYYSSGNTNAEEIVFRITEESKKMKKVTGCLHTKPHGNYKFSFYIEDTASEDQIKQKVDELLQISVDYSIKDV